MRIGVVFPQTEIGPDPAAIRDFAQTAEGLGFAHLLAYDHVLGAVHAGREPKLTGPYTERSAFHEPFVLFGYLAALTRRLELVTGVLILPQRQTALVAKQAAEVDLLSGERLRLGVGLGWNWVEYESLDEDFSNRGVRIEEQVELLRRLWTEPVVEFTGRFHRVDRAGLEPRPRRRIPVWFGGFTEPALRRAARIADGFIFGFGGPRLPEQVERLRGWVREGGRDPAGFGIESMVDFRAGPEGWREELERSEKAGLSHLSFRTLDSGFASPAEHIEALRRFAEVAGLR